MVDGINKDTNKSQGKKENKVIKVISNFLFIVFMITITFFIFITAQSRLTGSEPSILRHRIYIVESGSMLPTLKIDSMLIVRELPADKIGIGDIVSYYGEGVDVRITHRVVDIKDNGNTFITRGDANNINDPNILEKDRLIGKVVFSIPFVGKIFKTLSNPISIIILIIIGMAWILIPMLVKNRNKVATKKDG